MNKNARLRDSKALGNYRLLFVSALALTFVVGYSSVSATTLPSGFTEAAWGSSIGSSCTAMAFAPDGRLFVCQQNGALRVISKTGMLLPTAFVTLTVDNPANGERGLLGVTFDPAFASNHLVYVYYTVPLTSGVPAHNRISRFVANGDVSSGAEQVLVNLDSLSSATNHNGGAIHFGPDGKLYVGVGENGNGANAQSLNNRLGKVLRINADGSVITGPGANPTTFPGIAGSPTGANLAIWAVGLRNPFTFAFQSGTTRMFIDDVGQSTWEEINDGLAGKNYGWPNSEGPDNLGSSYTGPLLYYGHGSNSTSTGCAIIGGAFYNPDILQFPTSYVGKYFFGDLCNGWIRVMDTSNNTSVLFASGLSDSLVDILVGPDGALYYLLQGGQVMRIQATPSQALNISTRARVETGDNVLIGGFIVTGSGAKNVIIRAIGPSLPAALGPLADPMLEIHGPAPSNAVIASNDDWRVPVQNQTDVQATGLQPSDDRESALVMSLQPGTYTAIVSGKSSSSGMGLVEVYDLNTGASSQLGNISSRGHVQTGNNVMIGGFIVGNNIGADRMVVRAIGPSLSESGLSSVLADPTLELHDSNGTLIEFNDNWQDDPNQAALITDSGLAPTNSLESAILTGLAPGTYTAIVAGKSGGTGIGLVEVYQVQ